MDLGVTDRVYLLTGATRGLGFATAEVLVGAGARVVVSGRHSEAVTAAAESLGANAVGHVADNADEATGARLVAAATSQFGRLDGALISVGGPPVADAVDATDAQWRESFESVFLGALRIARAAAEAMGEGGSIAFVLSSSVKSPVAGLAMSNGLRPGLAMVAKQLADELGPRGIRVNGLLPGRIDTERVRELDRLSGDAQATRERIAAGIPLRRYGRPEEFGSVAAFLLSPASSYLTGAMIPVDGGMLRSL